MSNKFAFIAIVMLVPVCCYAGENRVDAALISQVETTTSQEYNEEKEKLLAKIRERKANLDEKDISLATDWPKSVLYNKAYALFLSVKEAASSNRDLDQCYRQSIIRMAKVQGIAEYQSVIPGRDQVRWELKSRLFEAELTFPAFGFLNQTNGPNALYDFDGMYSCLMSSVR